MRVSTHLVLEVRSLVTVADVTSSVRGLGAEVEVGQGEVGQGEAGLGRPSVINCDGLHTVVLASLTGPLGRAGDDIMRRVRSAA